MKRLSACLLTLMLLCVALGVSATETEVKTYEYTETVLMLGGGDHEIPATVVLPTGAEGEKFPVVIMCHGYGSNRDEAGGGYALLAPKLAEKGIATIRFDVIGCGESTADYANFTFETARMDALTCAEYMRAQPQIDSERVGMLGWSMGGGIAMLTASQTGMFKTVCTWAGALYDGEINQEEYAAAKEKGTFEVTFDWREPLNQGAAYYEVAEKTHIPQLLHGMSARILTINGSKDDVVPPESGATIVELAGNKASKNLIIEDADHTFNIFSGDMTKFEELMDATVAWFAETL